MIYSFISLPFCPDPDPDPDPQIYADPDPGRPKTCGSCGSGSGSGSETLIKTFIELHKRYTSCRQIKISLSLPFFYDEDADPFPIALTSYHIPSVRPLHLQQCQVSTGLMRWEFIIKKDFKKKKKEKKHTVDQEKKKKKKDRLLLAARNY